MVKTLGVKGGGIFPDNVNGQKGWDKNFRSFLDQISGKLYKDD